MGLGFSDPDMCETCESGRREGRAGHDTYMKRYCGFGLAIRGVHIWFCSIKCLRLSPVPTIDDGFEPGEVNLL